MPVGNWVNLRLRPGTLARLHEERAHVLDLHTRGVIDAHHVHEGWITLDALINHLLDSVHAHRDRAKAQSARKRSKPPDGNDHPNG